jgi:hypothetical protein
MAQARTAMIPESFEEILTCGCGADITKFPEYPPSKACVDPLMPAY